MGPLKGYKFIEIAGIGPSQFCGMLLADMGAEIIRVDRINPAELGVAIPPELELLNRSRRSVAIDLKNPDGVETVLKLCEQADGIFEAFRPGVVEKMGLGPDICLERNPKLVYGRITGWGQTGPLARVAGHDPNFIAITGVLDAIGERGGAPVIPLNLIGDFGGGGVFAAMGMLAAVLEAAKSGQGQVIDCAMVDGAASLLTLHYGMLAAGMWNPQRGHNILDGGAHFFSTYRTKDDRYVVIGPIEPRFYKLLLEKMEIDDEDFKKQYQAENWPVLKEKLQAVFLTRTRAEWSELLEGTDACFSPVLAMSEVQDHSHNQERQTFVEQDDVIQPAPAPRFSRTPAAIQGPPPKPGQHTQEVMQDWGFSTVELEKLLADKVIAQY